MEELDIVAAGYAGEAGAACIAREKFNEMLRRFRKGYAEHLCEENDMPEPEPCCFVPAGEGGILAALYLAAKERKCGLRIALRKIPVRQDTIELCELYGLNPYRLFSRCAVYFCGNGERLAEQLREKGVPAARIGRLTRGLDKVITDKTETEYLNRPEPDELLKVLPEMKLQNLKNGGRQ